jgi:hypothetical protein
VVRAIKWVLQSGLGGPGHKEWVLPRGLRGLVGRKNKSIRAARGFGSAFWALGVRGVNRQVNLRLRFYGHVDIWIRR